MLYCIQNSSYQNLFLNLILIFTLDLFANVKAHIRLSIFCNS